MSAGKTSRASSWYINANDQRYGPYTAEQVANWIALGRVNDKSMLSDGGDWISVREFVRRQAKAIGAPPEQIDFDVPLEELPSEDASDPFSPPPLPQVPSELTSPNVVGPAPRPAAAPAPAPGGVAEGRQHRATPVESDAPPERDRIVVIGRRQSGKTIFLASLYEKLWRSLNGVTARALSGDAHRQLMLAHQSLRNGQWPAATLGTSQIELEIEHNGKKRLMVTLDYAGELFRKAFLEDDSEFPGVKDLVNHIDRAAAVILLVDPSVVTGTDHEAAMDDDFGLVQAVQRIRNWPDGEQVPIVLALTKMDQYQGLLDRFGSSKEFVRQQFPALVRVLKQIPIFQVSAVQVEAGPDSRLRPRGDFQPINIDGPLRFCLKAIDDVQEKAVQERRESERRSLALKMERDRLKQEARQNRIALITIIAIVAIGAAIAALVLIHRS